MPIYTYRREDGTTFDYRQRFLDGSLETCPTTGQAVNRVIQPTGIIFKGSGFYVNDNNKAKANGESSADGEAKKSDSKSDSKPENKSEKREATPAAKKSKIAT